MSENRQSKQPVLPGDKDIIPTSGRPQPIVARTVDEAWRLALFARSIYGDEPELLVNKILAGSELGLTPHAAIRGIHAFRTSKGNVVVHLSPKMGIGIVKRSGLCAYYKVEITGEGSGLKALARGKRTDTGEEMAVGYSLEQATNAGLMRKDNWQRYPERMLTWRVTGWLIDQLWPDVLFGFPTDPGAAEEMYEHEQFEAEPIDITPKVAPKAEPLDGATKAENPEGLPGDEDKGAEAEIIHDKEEVNEEKTEEVKKPVKEAPKNGGKTAASSKPANKRGGKPGRSRKAPAEKPSVEEDYEPPRSEDLSSLFSSD